MTRDEIMEGRYRKFVEEHLDYYGFLEQCYLKSMTIEDVNNTDRYLPDVIRQILEEIGYYEGREEENELEAFISIIDNEFGLEKNIVEVGGGIIPSLANKISLRQKTGTITVYDPRLTNYHPERERFVLKKEKFTNKTPVNNADLLIGFMPCDATENIIESAIKHNKDFVIAMSDGGFHGEIDYYESTEEWIDSMLYLAQRGLEDNNMGQLVKLPFTKYRSPYPVIYNKRKQ